MHVAETEINAYVPKLERESVLYYCLVSLSVRVDMNGITGGRKGEMLCRHLTKACPFRQGVHHQTHGRRDHGSHEEEEPPGSVLLVSYGV